MAREQVGTVPVRPDDAATLGWLFSNRVPPRVISVLSAAVPAFDTDLYDCLDITDLVEDITSMSAGMTGVPANFQKLMVRIFSPAPQLIAWGDAYLDSGVAMLPSHSQAGLTISAGLEYNAARGLWICLAADPLGY